MDLIHRDIQKDVKECYDKIKEYEYRLSVLRKKCNHPKKENVNYEFRPGRIVPQTRVCTICGEVINICGNVIGN